MHFGSYEENIFISGCEEIMSLGPAHCAPYGGLSPG
jgi:hypothetical protein